MSFLAPLFLLGAVTVALPIVFHFIRRSAKDRVPFSSLMFLRPSPPRLTRRSRLEDILLLILRCLVIFLVACGFARPYLKSGLPIPETYGRGKKIVLLVDTSASMGRNDLWPETIRRASQLLERIGPEDQVALASFAHSFNLVAGFEELSNLTPEQRAAAIKERLQTLKPGWEDTQLGTALMEAARALEESQGKALNLQPHDQEIVVLTDLQEGSHLEALQGFQWPPALTVRLEIIGKKSPPNAGIQWVADSDDLGPQNDKLTPRVRVSNSRDSVKDRFQIGWAQGEDAFLGPTTNIYVPPGQGRTAGLTPLPSGLRSARALLKGDEVPFDNNLFVTAPEPRQLKVLFIGSEKDQDSSEPFFYLQHAFLDTRRQQVKLTKLAPGSFDQFADSKDLTLVVVGEVLPEEWTRPLRQFLMSGKTVLVMMKSDRTAETIGRLVQVPNVTAEEKLGNQYVMLKEIDFQHALFAPLADPKFRDFTKIHFWKHRAIHLAGMQDLRIVARFDDDVPALIELGVGNGKLLVLTSGWHPGDSQFALSSKFVPFCQALLELGSDRTIEGSQYFIGDSINLPSAPGTIRKPDGQEIPLANGEKFSQTDVPGIYHWSGHDAAFQFSVNLRASESQTAPMSTVDLERMGVPVQGSGASRLPDLGVKTERRATHLEQQQKIWRWLLVASIVVLFVETWIAGWLTRSRVNVPTEIAT